MKRLAVLAFATSCLGQQREIGGDFGYGFYRNGTIYSSAQSAQAGIRNRFTAGVNLGYALANYVAARFSYLYHDGHPFLQGAGTKTDIQGQSHALTLELLFHFKTRQHRLRPFVSGGAGGKDYVVAGPEPFPQPIPQIANLTTNDVWKVVLLVGGGISYKLRPHVMVQAEFRDYITTFPRQQIVPAPHNTARGVFEQFTPVMGVSYAF